MPVVGFNSGKYDINLIKPYFVRRFLLREENMLANATVIKRNNDFISISTKKLLFLDMVNFLAPGFSYSKYLAAYKVPETKGFFPYEYFKDLSQLDETELPPKMSSIAHLKTLSVPIKITSFVKRFGKKIKCLRSETFLSDITKMWYRSFKP